MCWTKLWITFDAISHRLHNFCLQFQRMFCHFKYLPLFCFKIYKTIVMCTCISQTRTCTHIKGWSRMSSGSFSWQMREIARQVCTSHQKELLSLTCNTFSSNNVGPQRSVLKRRNLLQEVLFHETSKMKNVPLNAIYVCKSMGTIWDYLVYLNVWWIDNRHSAACKWQHNNLQLFDLCQDKLKHESQLHDLSPGSV